MSYVSFVCGKSVTIHDLAADPNVHREVEKIAIFRELQRRMDACKTMDEAAAAIVGFDAELAASRKVQP